MFKLLNGPQTLGNSRGFWISFSVVLALMLAYPLVADAYSVGNIAYLLLWVFMAMGLSLIWGYGGILSFGQTFFFGIAGYGYGVLAINMGGGGTTILALAMAVALAALAALVLGYFIIWGGVGGVFIGIVTLSATLVLAFFLGQTAGPEWRIGDARLNGFNGMKGMDGLNIPWFDGENFQFEGVSLYYVVVALLLIVYLALRMLVNSRFGNVVVAIREDIQRAELLGYDTRRYQLAIFVIGSSLAGLSGALYTSWGQFITPASIGLPAAAMPIVWVAFSGRSDITATMTGSFLILLAFQTITVYSQQAALVLMGAMLLVTVLVAPQGFAIGVARLGARLWRRGAATTGAVASNDRSEGRA